MKKSIDQQVLGEILDEMVGAIGSLERIRCELPLELRKGLDEVVDTARTGRIWVSELEKTEKTYIGTKVEIVVRAYFAFPKGRLDLRIAHHDVDIKNTVGKTWMIPREAVGCPCLLLAEDDVGAVCSAGLLVARKEWLTGSENQDGKRSVSVKWKKQILWLFRNEPMPYFWSGLDRTLIKHVMDGRVGGTERLVRLFENVQGQPVSRDVIKAVARQRDYMKRLRRNGGARDPLGKKGIVVLSGAYDRVWIEALGLPRCSRSEFIAFTPSKRQWRELQAEGIVG